MKVDKNIIVGLCLSFFGVLFSLGSYTILRNTPLTAMGIGIIIIGISWALTPVNPIPKETIRSIIKSTCNNIEALLEATGAMEKAVYIPSKKLRETIAYIPLGKQNEITIQEISDNDGGIIIKRGRNIGVIIIPPKIDFKESIGEENIDVDTALNYALMESEIAESINTIKSDNEIIIEINKPKIDIEYQRFKIVMGSLPSCIAAQTISTILLKPIKIIDEKRIKDKLIVKLKVLEWIETVST